MGLSKSSYGTKTRLNYFLLLAVSYSSIQASAVVIDRDGGTFHVDRATSYSGACERDPNGGGNQIASMLGSPGNHTADGRADDGVAVVATTQEGGTKELFGCFFVMKQKPGKLFFAGDKYAKSQNGINKIDVSMTCEDYKGIDYLADGADITVLNCSEEITNDSAYKFYRAGIEEAKQLAAEIELAEYQVATASEQEPRPRPVPKDEGLIILVLSTTSMANLVSSIDDSFGDLDSEPVSDISPEIDPGTLVATSKTSPQLSPSLYSFKAVLKQYNISSLIHKTMIQSKNYRS